MMMAKFKLNVRQNIFHISFIHILHVVWCVVWLAVLQRELSPELQAEQSHSKRKKNPDLNELCACVRKMSFYSCV